MEILQYGGAKGRVNTKDGIPAMERKTDLTRGAITDKLLMVAVPIMGTQLMQMTYNLVDMYWLGHTQDATTALAASGMGGMFMWLSMALMMFGRMGAEIGVSQNLGRGDMDQAERYARSAIVISAMLGVIFGGTLLIFARPFITMMGLQEPKAYEAAVVYLRIAALGIPMTYVTAAVTGVFNGAGNSKLSFLCNAVGLVINMILDPIMINWFGWGVAGAALATIIGQGSVCALFLISIKRHKKRPLPNFRFRGKIGREISGQIIKWAWPISLESGLFTLLAMVVTRMVAEHSLEAVTVQRIGSQIESLSWLIGGGFGSAVTAFIGQNFGARQFGRIRSGFRISLTWLLIWQSLVTAVLFFFGGPLFSVFINDGTVQSMGAVYLKILSVCVVFGAFEGACSGAFRGMGQTLPPSVSSIASNLLRPVLCYFLAQRMGLNGLWWGISLSATLRGLWIGIWYALSARRTVAQFAKNEGGAVT